MYNNVYIYIFTFHIFTELWNREWKKKWHIYIFKHILYIDINVWSGQVFVVCYVGVVISINSRTSTNIYAHVA